MDYLPVYHEDREEDHATGLDDTQDWLWEVSPSFTFLGFVRPEKILCLSLSLDLPFSLPPLCLPAGHHEVREEGHAAGLDETQN